jgi:MFS family permease
VFWAAAIPGFASILVVLLLTRETSERRQIRSAEKPKTTSAVSLSPPYYYVLFAVAMFSLGNSSDMFLVLRAQSAGIPIAYAPLLGLVFNITYTAFSWPAGKLSDSMPRHLLVASGYAVFAAVYAVFAWAPSHTALWAMMALYGLYYALTTPVLKGLVVDNAPREARGRAFGIFYFLTSVAALLSSVITGELWKHFGPRLPLLISTGTALVAAILLSLVPKRNAALT